jgi:plasmid stability protein
MRNVTIALDEQTLAAGREYASAHHTSLNSLIRELLQRTVVRESRATWADEFLELAAKAGGDSQGRQWKRKDLYRA